MTSQTTEILPRLRARVRGEVLGDPVSLGLYATDASMYQFLPVAVVVPLDREDVLETIRVCAETGTPILPRGGGTSLTGQTVGHAVVIDVSKHLNRLLELNVEERWARVEPGLVCDELNALLAPHRLHFAPDPATSNRANIGGMIANNAAGMRSIKYGMCRDHVLELELALATGEVLRLAPMSGEAFAAACRAPGREGDIYRGLRELIEANREEIRARYPKVIRRSGGYLLDALVDAPPWNLALVATGSEGTLGTILSAKVNLEPVPAASGLCLAQFDTIGECLRAVAPIVSHGPSAVELIDGIILAQAREHPLTRDTCRIIEGAPAGVLVIEARADTLDEVQATLQAIVDDLRARGMGAALPILLEPDAIRDVWVMRSSALGLMTTVKGSRKPVPYIEDAAVPPEHLPDYIEEVLEVCRRHGRPVSLFAHASVGLLHIRPLHDLHDPADIDALRVIQGEVFELVLKYQGSWSGEHGDGIVRGGYNRRFFGDQLYRAFCDLKRLFDPAGLMNPGKIVETPEVTANLRLGADRRGDVVSSQFHYRDDGGLLSAVEQCTGVGACRKTRDGVMCPSYMATRDEIHSTRGRANALRLAITGQLGPDAIAGEELHAVFDLCLSCKGCKSECPNRVDVGRMKAEVLHAHHQRHGVSWRDRLVAHSRRLAALGAGPHAPLVNAWLGSWPTRVLLDRCLGLDRRRRLPAYTSRPFSRWFDRRPPPARGGRRVALFCDTYLEYHEPAVGQAAVTVLEAAGYSVELARVGDSLRPAISRGMLDLAKCEGTKTLQALSRFADRQVPVLVCEPSCHSALTDDLPDLVDDPAPTRRVAGNTFMIDAFLEQALVAGVCTLPWASGPAPRILVHPHCHQHTGDTRKLLSRIPGATVRETRAGCCGMAGSFGYETEHYDLSRKIASDRLIPAIEAADPDTWIVANGFSCRHQIADLCQRTPLHSMDVVRRCLATAPGAHDP